MSLGSLIFYLALFAIGCAIGVLWSRRLNAERRFAERCAQALLWLEGQKPNRVIYPPAEWESVFRRLAAERNGIEVMPGLRFAIRVRHVTDF